MPYSPIHLLFGLLLLCCIACNNETKPDTNSPEVKLEKMMKAIEDLHIMQGASPNTVMNEETLDQRLRELNKYRKNIQTQYLVLQNKEANAEDQRMIELLFKEDQRIGNEYQKIAGKKFKEAIPVLELLIAQSKALNTSMKGLREKYTPNS